MRRLGVVLNAPLLQVAVPHPYCLATGIAGPPSVGSAKRHPDSPVSRIVNAADECEVAQLWERFVKVAAEAEEVEGEAGGFLREGLLLIVGG